MHSLIKASKKQLGLTGTIAGGMAHHLYYLLWRLDPQRMRKRGFIYQDEIGFVKKYGTLETLYELPEGSVIHNSASRGRKITSPTAKPGISPMIFRDFLIDKAVTLDLSDLSRYLPKLFENVITVPCDDNVRYEYSKIILQLKQAGGHRMNPLTSAMLQFSLSYPDKPFGYGSIINPKTGGIAATPEDYDYSYQLLPKEEKLVELINQEQAEGRNVFVYCEYTGDGPQNITKRIKDIIERNCGLCGKVAILESSNPPAAEREEWIHKKASEDIRVIISNPRCIETGLDFVFTYNEINYNYPTLIYMQLGYNLFTLWQASRRHYRLNQTEECRTYYLAYRGTIQEKVIEIMAQKEFATACIQGSFSQEGLAAMANGVDARMKLVQAMVDNTFDEDNTESIRNMFDVINKANNSTTSDMNDEHGNVLFKELMGYEIVIEAENAPEEISIDLTGDIFDYFSMTREVVQSEAPPKNETFNEEPFMELFFASFACGRPEEKSTEVAEPGLVPYKCRKKKNGVLEGQSQVFDLLNL